MCTFTFPVECQSGFESVWVNLYLTPPMYQSSCCSIYMLICDNVRFLTFCLKIWVRHGDSCGFNLFYFLLLKKLGIFSCLLANFHFLFGIFCLRLLSEFLLVAIYSVIYVRNLYNLDTSVWLL